MILNDRQTANRPGMISPYELILQNGESYDLTLGTEIKIRRLMPWWNPRSWKIFRQPNGSWFIARKAYWQTVSLANTSQIAPYWVKPGATFLGSSQQRLNMPSDLVAIGFLKSGRARELMEHLQAVYVDATFQGNLTLEFVNLDSQPMAIWEGMRVMQLAFLKTTPAMEPYASKGHYQGDVGTQESKGYFL